MTEKKKIRIYFAHSHKWWKSKREKMITDVLESRGYEVVDPFDYEDAINEKYGVKSYSENRTEAHANDITEKDWELIVSCDELFAWFPLDTTTIGTPLELGWAKNLGMKVTGLYKYAHPFLWSKRVGLYKFYVGYQNFKDDKPLFVRD